MYTALKSDTFIVASLSFSFLYVGVLFPSVCPIMAVLVVCMCCIHRATVVEQVPLLLQNIHHFNTKLSHYCASVDHIKQCIRGPKGQIGRQMDCQARWSGEPLQQQIKEVACIPCLHTVFIRHNISYAHSKVWYLLRTISY